MARDWHPVALSGDLDMGTSAGFRLDDRELVVWRDDKGVAHVWDDRCPHRGMRLSFGFVRGDHLACLYHGWQYDRAGQCRYIPAHPNLEVPATIAVPVFQSREWAGIIWTSLQEADNTEAQPIEDLETTPVRSVYLNGSLEDMVSCLAANGLDAGDAVTRLEGNLCRITSTSLSVSALAAFQPVSATRTGLHLVIVGTAPLHHQESLAAGLAAFRDRFGAAN